MSDQNEKLTSPSLPGSPAAAGTAVERKWITDAVGELNITRKNVRIYPDEHAQIQTSIERSFLAMQRIFKRLPKLTITVTDQKLIIEQESLDSRNKKFKEFADSLRRHEIVSVTLYEEIGKEELLRFLRLLAAEPDTIREQGGVETAARDHSLLNIEIRTIDFSKLHLTEEEKILVHPDAKDKDAESTWHNLVMNLVSGAITDSEKGIDLFDSRQVTPKELADFLNGQSLTSIQSVRMFQKLFQMSLEKLEDAEADEQHSARHFDHINLLLQELNPRLRKQFLAIAFQHCNQKPEERQSRHIIRNLREQHVVEMMKQANERDQEISPSLVEFVRKMAAIPGRNAATPGLPDSDEMEIEPEDVETLFQRESYEDYVTDEYADTLSGLSAAGGGADTDGTGQFVLEEHLESLEEKNLDFQIARVLIAFMNEGIEPDEYMDYSKRLISIFHNIGITRSEDFTFLKEVFFTFKLHAIHKSNPALRSMAQTCLKEIEQPLFFARAVDAFDKLGHHQSDEAIEFLILLGPKIVPELVNLFAKYENPDAGMHLVRLLSNFAEEAGSEIKKRIHDPRPKYVRNLVFLIRKIGNESSAPDFIHLLDHPDETIKLETLAALLKFHHPRAGELLCELLGSNQPEIVSRAIQLSGRYRVQETAPPLVEMITTPMILPSSIRKNTQLIRVLGDIGNPVAIPVLEKLGRTSFTLFPAAMTEMKLAIFETLGNYPEEAIPSLLKIGIHMQNKKIRNICQQYFQNLKNKNHHDFHNNT